MLRAIRRILVLLVIAALAGGGLLTFITKPKLEAADRDVRTAWQSLQTPLDQRFKSLRHLQLTMNAAGRTIALSNDLDEAMRVWQQHKGDLDQRIVAANRLESIAARLKVIIAASPRFSSNRSVARAFDDFQQHAADRDTVDAVDNAIDHANSLRDGFLRRIVASMLGHVDHTRYLPT